MSFPELTSHHETVAEARIAAVAWANARVAAGVVALTPNAQVDYSTRQHQHAFPWVVLREADPDAGESEGWFALSGCPAPRASETPGPGEMSARDGERLRRFWMGHGPKYFFVFTSPLDAVATLEILTWSGSAWVASGT